LDSFEVIITVINHVTVVIIMHIFCSIVMS